MIIDLHKDERLGFIETTYEMLKIKSNKLMKEINLQRTKTGQNFMIVPMSIYNLLESNDSFKFSKIENLMKEDLLRHMGSINDIEVYLDLFAPSDTIILKYDKSITRDNRIEAILNGDELKQEIEITVLNY